MSKPLLLSAGQSKVQEFVGTANAQVPTWSEAGQEWVAAGTPYDVAGEYIGKPPVSTVLMRFVSNRSWTLKNSLVRASCTAFPTGSNAVATVSIAGSNLTNGTITWTTGSTVTVGSFTDTTITSGQAVVVTLTTADSGNTFENPFFTLGGVVA
jgi:hypothetical protein